MVPIDVWCASNLPVKRNGTRKPLSHDRESVHDPGIDRAIDGVAPQNVLHTSTGEIAKSSDFPIERGKSETHVCNNHISSHPPRPHLTGVLISPDQFRKVVPKKISGPDKVPIQTGGPDELADKIERTDAQPHLDVAGDYISPQEISKSGVIEICYAGDRPLQTRRWNTDEKQNCPPSSSRSQNFRHSRSPRRCR